MANAAEGNNLVRWVQAPTLVQRRHNTHVHSIINVGGEEGGGGGNSLNGREDFAHCSLHEFFSLS